MATQKARPQTTLPAQWLDRVVELRRLRPSELDDHPLQWKVHTAHQKAVVTGMLDEVGIVDVGLAYVSQQTGRLTSIDGHLRKYLGDLPWPTIILDVTDAESNTILVGLDESASLSDADSDKLTAILAETTAVNADVLQFFTSMAIQYKAIPPDTEGLTQHPGRPAAQRQADDFDTSEAEGEVPPSSIHLVQLFLTEADYPAFKRACDRLAERYDTKTVTETVFACILEAGADA